MIKRLLLLLTIFLPLAAQAQYVTLTGTLQGSNGVTAQNYTLSFTPNQWFYVAGQNVTVATTTNCATSIDGSVVGLPNPLQTVVASPGFSGTLPPGNYYVEYTFIGTLSAETLPSPETLVQLTSTGEIDVNAPAQGIPSGAVGMRVYIGTAPGTETLQGRTVGNASFSQSVPLVAGSVPPAANNTLCTQIANDAGWPTGTGYKVALADSSGNTVPGYPMLWQLLGPNTTINLSNGLPYYHGVVTFPSPILASPYNHNLQSISGPLDFGGYNVTNAGRFTANSVNGVVDPVIPQSGVDLGTLVNNAFASCAYQCTVLLPAGGFSFAVQIVLPQNVFGQYKLSGQPGTVLTWTGATDAIVTKTTSLGQSNLTIEGFQLLNGGTGTYNAIHLYPTNRVTVQNMLIEGFASGDGIRVEGTNSSNILNNLITNNLNGVKLLSTFCSGSNPNITCSPTNTGGSLYSANAINIAHNQIANNSGWGVIFTDSPGNGDTGALNDSVSFNDLEQNAVGAIYAGKSTGLTVLHNYFEGSPREIVLGLYTGGAGDYYGTQGAGIAYNYFTTLPATPYNVELQNAAGTTLIGNSELLGAGTGGNNCFINVSTGGEKNTFLLPVGILQTPPNGTRLCINGSAAQTFAGTGSFVLYNANYLDRLVDAGFAISAGASDTVTSVQVYGTSSCHAESSNNGSQATAQSLMPQVYVKAAAGSFTIYHPTGNAGLDYDIWCSGPQN